MKKISFGLLFLLAFQLFPLSAQAFTPTSQQLASVVEIFSQLKSPQTGMYQDIASGSGFFVSSTGMILTNAHVVLQEDSFAPYDRYVICLTLSTTPPVCSYTANPVLIDDDNDLALLSVSNQGLDGKTISLPASFNTILWGDSSQLQVGDEIYSLGYPGVGGETITFTKGVVSGFIYNNNSNASEMLWIKTDANLNPGNSGGATLDKNGGVIGMPTLSADGQIGYLRPSNLIRTWKDASGSKILNKTLPVILKEIPSYVNDLYGTPGDASVTLSWTPAFSSDGIKEYQVIYDTKALDPDYSTQDPATLPHYFTTKETEVTISHLENDTRYYFYVRPVSNSGKTANYWSNQESATPAKITTPEPVKLFNDVLSSDKHALALSYLKTNQIIMGYPDGSFRADQSINRAEMIKLLVTGLKLSPDPTQYKNCFPDVHEEWYATYICYAKAQGWVAGYKNGTYKPSATVNRAESLKMILESYGVTKNSGGSTTKFYDVPSSSWYFPYVTTAENMQLLEEEAAFNAGRNISRGEVSENIYRASLMKKIGFPTAAGLWKDENGQNLKASDYFPLGLGREWNYSNQSDNSFTTADMHVAVSDTCGANCFLLEQPDATYTVRITGDQVKGTAIQFNNNMNKAITYLYPEMLFVPENHINYFKLQEPVPLSDASNGRSLSDGVNFMRFDGFTTVDTPDGKQQALKVHSIDLVRIFAGYDAASAESLIQIEADKYFVKGIGLVKSVTTTTIMSGSDSYVSGKDTAVLTSYK